MVQKCGAAWDFVLRDKIVSFFFAFTLFMYRATDKKIACDSIFPSLLNNPWEIFFHSVELNRAIQVKNRFAVFYRRTDKPFDPIRDRCLIERVENYFTLQNTVSLE